MRHRRVRAIAATIAFIAGIVALSAFPVKGQVLAPEMHPQFVDGSGKPLAGGFLYSYASGTSTLQATYADPLLTIQNANPIPLDATGAPSNGSAQVQLWLSNASYRFCAYNSALVLQWCSDNVTSYLQLLNQTNTWTFAQTFTQPLIETQTDNQMVFGTAGNQTTLDFPPPATNITLHMPNINDTVVGRTTTDTLTNKTLTSPNINGVLVPNSPGTYQNIPNSIPTGTVPSELVILTGAPSAATVATTTSTSGVIGICVAGCGNTGTAVIQESGQVPCVFAGGTTAGDYVQASQVNGGQCTDAGATYPLANQVVGRILTTNGGAGTYSIMLFGPEQKSNAGYKLETISSTPATVGNTTTPTNLITFTVPANEIGQNQTFYFDAQGIMGDQSPPPTFTLTVVLDGVTVCSITPTLLTANNQPWSLHGFFTGLSTGTSGSVTGCHIDWSSSPSGGGHIGNEFGVGSPAQVVTVDTTVSHTLSFQITWGAANPLATITQNTLILYRVG